MWNSGKARCKFCGGSVNEIEKPKKERKKKNTNVHGPISGHVLHTAVADHLRKIATSPENLAELKMESDEYRREIRGEFDYDIDPYDRYEE